MFNNFYKTIHKRYSRFLNFIFFLRYLLIIFFISFALFISFPIFFNYEKKAEAIKSHLLENYNIKIFNYEKIKYNIFPSPNLELDNLQIKFKSSEENFSVKKMNIFFSLLNIYKYENFGSNKLVFKDSNITSDTSNFKFLIKNFFYQKNKIYFDNLKIKIIEKNIPIVTLSNIKFFNYGYNKNLIKGKIFDKNFKIKIRDDYKNINFKLPKSGVKAELNFDVDQIKKLMFGDFKLKILNTNLKFNFKYDGNVIKIYNSYLRNKDISLQNKSEITLNPFLDTKTKLIVEELNLNLLKKIDFVELLRFKEILKKINNESEITFKLKKINRKFFDEINFKTNLTYGNMDFSKRLSDKKNSFLCDGNINFLEEFPMLFFDCFIQIENKKNFFKKFAIKIKNKNDGKLKLSFKGNLSVLNKKISFKKISINDNYEASKEDLRYFKETFENVFFDKNYIEILNLKKVKEFIIEIS